MSSTARIFKNGRSQAVRLPAEYRFDSSEVFIRRDEATGDVILSAKPENWDGFFAALASAEVPEDFLSAEERNQQIPQPDPFADWPE